MPRTRSTDRCSRTAIGGAPALERHAPLLRALADEARLTLVARLSAAGAPVCVCDLTTGLELAPATLSHHLKVLRDAGVVRAERRGTWVYYSIELSVLGALAGLVAALAPRAAAPAESTRAEAS